MDHTSLSNDVDILSDEMVKLRTRISKIPLGEFAVEDIGPIVRLFGISGKLYDSDIRAIKIAIDRINDHRYTDF